MLSEKSVVRRHPDVVLRKGDGPALLLDGRDGKMFETTEVGAFIWARLDGTATIARIIDAIVAQYEAPREVVARDVFAWIEELHRREIATVTP